MTESKQKGLLKGLTKSEYAKKYYNEHKEKFKVNDEKQAMKKSFCPVCKSSFISKYFGKHENTNLHKKNVERFNKTDTESKIVVE